MLNFVITKTRISANFHWIHINYFLWLFTSNASSINFLIDLKLIVLSYIHYAVVNFKFLSALRSKTITLFQTVYNYYYYKFSPGFEIGYNLKEMQIH